MMKIQLISQNLSPHLKTIDRTNFRLNARRTCTNEIQQSQLENFFKKTIKLTGPILLRHYINECLYNPKYGYYTTGAKIGIKDSDFITAPQKSPLFCHLVAHTIRYELQNIYQLKKSKVKIVELGPGRGNLVASVLALLNTEIDKIEYVCLVECSESHRDDQFKLLNCEKLQTDNLPSNDKQIMPILSGRTPSNITINWYNSVYEIDHYKNDTCPYIIYNNEYFDSIPIQQYVKTIEDDNQSWKAVHVGIDDTDKLISTLRQDHKLKHYESEILTKYYKSRLWAEFSVDMFSQWRHCLEIISRNSGTIFNIDYGYISGQMPISVTLRAFQNHKIVSVLHEPGKCDITADLDFSTFHEITKLFPNLLSHRILTQGEFLFNLKIDLFKEKLIQHFPDKENSINDDVKYLTDPDCMGSRFKVHVVGHNSQISPLCFS